MSQHRPAASFMVTPSTTQSCFFRITAAAELSTPPLMATRTRFVMVCCSSFAVHSSWFTDFPMNEQLMTAHRLLSFFPLDREKCHRSEHEQDPSDEGPDRARVLCHEEKRIGPGLEFETLQVNARALVQERFIRAERSACRFDVVFDKRHLRRPPEGASPRVDIGADRTEKQCFPGRE